MSARKLNESETKLHQAVLSAPNKQLFATQLDAVIPEPKARQNALNFLLSAGLFIPLNEKKGRLGFRAVSKGEITATKDLNNEEKMVLSHINEAQNEGIWTKHLKAKTSLHQTIIDRCIKTLTQKLLIKRVQSVQHATRKIYMLQGLEPSIALTGGPWYTDNELDTEFIDTLMKACLKLIRDMSFPSRKSQSEGVIYPLSNSPKYPTAQHISSTLKKARLTETQLTVEHVEMLLNVLVLDGEIERLPSFSAGIWNTMLDSEDEDEEEDRKHNKRKRKHHSSDTEDVDSSRRRRKKKKIASDTESDSDMELKTRKTKVKAESDSEESTHRKKKRTSDDEGSDSQERRRKKKKKRSRRDDTSDSESDDSDGGRRNQKSRRWKDSESPAADESSGAYVYRAIKEERLSLGWSQAPCSKCPSFEFCKDGGPVNAKECVYYSDWLVGGTVDTIEDEA